MHGLGPGKEQVRPPAKEWDLCLKGRQAEASTLLHESSNSEPETI